MASRAVLLLLLAVAAPAAQALTWKTCGAQARATPWAPAAAFRRCALTRSRAGSGVMTPTLVTLSPDPAVAGKPLSVTVPGTTSAPPVASPHLALSCARLLPRTPRVAAPDARAPACGAAQPMRWPTARSACWCLIRACPFTRPPFRCATPWTAPSRRDPSPCATTPRCRASRRRCGAPPRSRCEAQRWRHAAPALTHRGADSALLRAQRRARTASRSAPRTRRATRYFAWRWRSLSRPRTRLRQALSVQRVLRCCALAAASWRVPSSATQ